LGFDADPALERFGPGRLGFIEADAECRPPGRGHGRGRLDFEAGRTSGHVLDPGDGFSRSEEYPLKDVQIVDLFRHQDG